MERGRFHKHTDVGQNLTVITANGSVTSDDIIGALEDFYKHSYTLNLLWDFTRAHETGIDKPQMHRIVEAAKSHAHLRAGGKTAIVGPEDAQFGVGRMYEAFSELAGHPVAHGVFRSVREALVWLNTKEERP